LKTILAVLTFVIIATATDKADQNSLAGWSSLGGATFTALDDGSTVLSCSGLGSAALCGAVLPIDAPRIVNVEPAFSPRGGNLVIGTLDSTTNVLFGLQDVFVPQHSVTPFAPAHWTANTISSYSIFFPGQTGINATPLTGLPENSHPWFRLALDSGVFTISYSAEGIVWYPVGNTNLHGGDNEYFIGSQNTGVPVAIIVRRAVPGQEPPIRTAKE